MMSVVSRPMRCVLALAIALAPIAVGAQVTAKTVASAPYGEIPSKWDIFVGYSYLSPNGTVQGFPYEDIDYGGIASVARFFNKHVGLQFEGDWHTESQDWPPGSNSNTDNSNDDFGGGSGGLILRYPVGKLTPWVHAVGGGERVGSLFQFDTWGWVATAGGGLDYDTPWMHHHLAIRIGQADYQYASIPFRADQGGTGTFNMMRLSTGVVFHIGNTVPPLALAMACTPSPVTVYAGDPVTISASVANANYKLHDVYSWSGSGASGSGDTTTVATGALAPGSYTVTGTVKEGKPGREGRRAWETASCTAVFTVKAYEPPTVSCIADPSTIKPGDTSTITATGVSPQNLPLTYSYSATAGTISGNGSTATYNSAGAPTGAVEVTCNVSDDKNQTATANTTVTITAPYVPPVPHAEALCTISFNKDWRRPTRVDNEAKACLDEVALDLQKQPDAKAVLVGEQTAAEKNKDMAAQRAVNTKQYLVKEKGIDASRISVVTGTMDGRAVEDYLVPSGADFAADVPGTTPVDETMVKPQERRPLRARPRHRNPDATGKQ